MKRVNVLVFEGNGETCTIHKVADKPTGRNLDPANLTVLTADNQTIPAREYQYWDEIKDKLIPS